MSLYTTTRDFAQRTFGCLGFSMIAHVTVLGTLIFMPQHRFAPDANASERSTIDLAVEAQKGAPPETTIVSPRASKPKVLLAKGREAAVQERQAKLEPEEKPLDDFQPTSIASENKNENIPEELSPEISDEPSPETTEPSARPVVASVVTAIAIPVSAPPQTAPVAHVAARSTAPAGGQLVAAATRPSTLPAGQPNGALVAAGSAVDGTPTGTSGYAGGSGQIMDASLRKPISGLLPHYSQQDRVLGREGLAVVVARVHSDGSVDGVYVERSSGSRDMDQAAIESFKSWKFVPGPEASVRKSFQFSLKGEAQNNYAKLKR